MVNFSEKARESLKNITSTSLLPLLSLVLDKSAAQPHYKTHYLNGVLKWHWKDEILAHHQQNQAQYCIHIYESN